MTTLRLSWVVGVLVCLSASACGAQQGASDMVVSSDPELVEIASRLLPELAQRSGMELKGPVRLERRSREQLERYLQTKLDEELPPDEAKATVDSYALLGLVPSDLDLRSVLLALYTEQVAGFYEPDSTALFVMDDQPRSSLESLLMHELVHAIQDQNADLDALTDPTLGNDRAIAAQAAIEGQATLVMLEFMTEQMTGSAVDLSQVPDFAARMRPALEGLRSQFPALAGAPPVIQESLLFPYVEGTAFVQKLWSGGRKVAPFGDHLPLSTEEVLEGVTDDPPVELGLTIEGARVVHEDVLGRLEIGVLLDEDLGSGLATPGRRLGGRSLRAGGGGRRTERSGLVRRVVGRRHERPIRVGVASARSPTWERPRPWSAWRRPGGPRRCCGWGPSRPFRSA